MCVCAHVYWQSWRSEEDVGSPRAGVTGVLRGPAWVLGAELDSLF